MFDGFRSLLGAVGQRIEVIKEKSTQSLENIKQDSSKVVSSVNKNLQELAAVSKESIETLGGKIIPFSSGIDNRLHHHKDISFNAGSELVEGYAHILALLHHNNLIVAEKARLTYRMILASSKHCQSLDSQWKEMRVACEVLPELATQVVTIQERVQGLCKSIGQIESALTQLNEDTAQHQLESWKAEQNAKVAEHEQKRTEELKVLEAQLRKSHQVTSVERKQKALSRSASIEVEAEREKERVRAALDKQIQKSMDDFVIYGGFGAGSRAGPTEEEAIARLNSSAPALTSNELEDFLGPDDDSAGSESTKNSTVDSENGSNDAEELHSDSKAAVVVVTQDEEPTK